MARDTAIAGASCGPPMTVMPTRSNRSLSSARKVAVMKSRSTLPSMIWLEAAMVRSSAADRCSRARGNRAFRREVMVGLISRMRGRWGMRRPSGWLASSRAPQPQYQGDGHLECGGVEMRARGNVGRVQHGFAHLFDLQADRGAGGVPLAVQGVGVRTGVALAGERSAEGRVGEE